MSQTKEQSMPNSGKGVDVTTPSDREIRVTRVFDAPRELVFECHTKPELLRQWLLGPPGWTMPGCEVDFRVGGKYLYTWRNEADGSEFSIGGVHEEIVPPERIVTVESFMGDEALNTLTFDEKDGRTTLVLVMQFESREKRDQALATGMTDGMAFGYDRLDHLLEAQKAA
ncbi:MAG TPA: SRPBCC family protein [Gemmatimonadaceae bacterium]|nr:SRPBCC family protein [Gemmatimonadaceae bacterium]